MQSGEAQEETQTEGQSMIYSVLYDQCMYNIIYASLISRTYDRAETLNSPQSLINSEGCIRGLASMIHYASELEARRKRKQCKRVSPAKFDCRKRSHSSGIFSSQAVQTRILSVTFCLCPYRSPLYQKAYTAPK